MTRCTVVWDDEALKELAAIWVRASDRRAVTTAVALIDEQLSIDPHSTGDELHEGLRALITSPLRIQFEVQTDDRLARVLTVALL